MPGGERWVPATGTVRPCLLVESPKVPSLRVEFARCRHISDKK